MKLADRRQMVMEQKAAELGRARAKILDRLIAIGGAGTSTAMSIDLRDGTHWWPDPEVLKALVADGIVTRKRLGGHFVYRITDTGRAFQLENPL